MQILTTTQMIREFKRVLSRVTVQDSNGNILGDVAQTATSVGAAKVAGRPCQFANRNGVWVWVAK